MVAARSAPTPGLTITGAGGMCGTEGADAGFDNHRCRRNVWNRGQRRRIDRLIDAHRGRRLYPHPHIIGLVQRDRDGIDPKEIRRHQHRMGGMIGSQLTQRRHRRQRADIGRRGTLMGRRRRGTIGTGLHQPRHIRHISTHTKLSAGPLPRPRLHSRHHHAQLVSHRGILHTHRRPPRRGRHQRHRPRTRTQQRRMHLRRRRQPHPSRHTTPPTTPYDTAANPPQPSHHTPNNPIRHRRQPVTDGITRCTPTRRRHRHPRAELITQRY